MINTRQLTPLFLALTLGATSLFAQTAPAEQDGSSVKPVTQGADKTAPEAQTPAAREPAPKSTPPATAKDSPFDYRSSEEISEDVPVSFPVDI
jgi:hypothetical protein